MGKVCSNLPANVVGPFKQTLFLGCTVKSFSSTVGWNEQETNVTVELVEDTCAPSVGSTKHYYPKPGQTATWNAADPGFQTPTVGAPVYFRVEDFEFAGVVQSWSKKEDSSSFPAYSVTISDPRFLLENLTIITGEYADEVKNVPNLINAYGWLESISDDVCQLDAGLECRPCTLEDGNYPAAESSASGRALLGSPADGFGGANENEEGVPWLRLKEAIQILLSGNTHTKYSPKGYAVFRGHSPVGIASPANGMGRIEADNFDTQIITDYNGNGYTTNYIVDISEIPFSPNYYRIGSTEQSLLSLISQVCGDAGCDFFIELIITSNLEKVIKVRTVQRRAQPALGEIEAFLTANNDYLISKNVGRELRNEPTSVFLYGANVESIYEVVPTGADGTLSPNNWLPNHWHEIPVTQHWGLDSKGKFQEVTYFDGDRYGQDELKEWDVQLDILALQEQLSKPLVNLAGKALSSYVVSETEFKMSMASFDTWYNYTLFAGITGTSQVPSQLYAIGIGTTFGNLLKAVNNFGAGLPFGGLKSTLSNNQPYSIAAGSVPTNTTIDWDGSLKSPISSKKKDLEKIHSFIKDVADTNYGKKFVVKVPEICYYKDHQSKNYIFSDSPTNAGYPPSGLSGVLGIPILTTGIELFEEEDTTKIQGIARYFFDASTDPADLKTGVFEIQGTEFVKIDTSLYSPMSVENKVYLFPTGTAPNTGVIPAVIVDIKTPVFSGDSQLPTNQGAYNIKMPGGSGSIPAGIKTSGDPFGDALAKAMSLAPHSYPPSGMAIPMRSNTQRYGPWGYVGPAGPVRFEEDTELAPWNYQGYDIMNSGANEKVVDGLTFMQAGERGGFTLVGYPIKQLGQDLRSPNKSFSSLTLQDKVTNYGTYKYIETTSMDGTDGPNITSINISIGEGGATTTYELATFTPSFGRMSKLNANRIKEIAKQRAKDRKSKREREKLLALTRKGGGPGFSAIISTIKDQVQGFIGADNKNQAKNLMMGVSSTLDGGDEDDEDLPITAGTDNSILSKRGAMQDEVFKQTAIMSQEGMFRPVSKSGDGDLPGFTTNISTIPGNESHSQCPMGPIEQWTAPIVNCSYLDPLTAASDNKHCVSNDDDAYHDILQVGFGTSINQNGGYGTTDLREFIAKGNDCPDDFRFLATKGPMVINGWGYDLQGKPIPNEADNATDARDGIYTKQDLTDKFMEGWLKKSKTWPVAPVDLRFDRARGVWTVPNTFRIIQIENTGNDAIPTGDSGPCKVLNPSTMYGKTGDPISTQSVEVSVPEWFTTGLATGASAYAFYDTNDAKWYPIIAGGGSGSSGGGPGMSVKDTGYCGYTPFYDTCEQYDCLIAGTGLKLTAGQGAAVLLADHYISDSGTCGITPTVTNKFFTHLSFGTGLSVESGGNCDFSINVQHKITDMDYCDHESAVNELIFNHLKFGNGLKAAQLGNCAFKIDANHEIGDEAYCGYVPTIGDTFFERITFGRGLRVIKDDPIAGTHCNYTVNAKTEIKDTQVGCDPPSTVPDYKDYFKLNLGSGLTATQNTLDCEYTIDASDVKIGVTGAGAGPHTPMRYLSIGTGLGLVDNGDCQFTLTNIGTGTGGGGGTTCKTTLEEGVYGSVTVTKTVKADGCFEYKVSGLDNKCSSANVAYVTDILCVGSGLEVQYGHLGFLNGCFTGAY